MFVEHAIGSLHKPMQGSQLAAKFHALSDPLLGAERSAALIAACWGIAQAADVRGLVALAQP